MIKSITNEDLLQCITIFHKGYETVALEFGLTEENCPDRGRANLPISKLIHEFEKGTLMFGYFIEGQLIGFLGIKISDNICKLNDIIILPKFRGHGYGSELLHFCKNKAKELGRSKITLGMIDDNLKLKQWYLDNGFVNVGYKKFEKAPFTIGYMECKL